MLNSPSRYDWLSRYDLTPAYKPAGKMVDKLIFDLAKAGIQYEDTHTFVTTPGLLGYCSPMIRANDNLTDVAKHAATSFRGLIADIWTQLLVDKRDAKEKPIYLLWDEEIPVPTEETALAWLLTCESWPMPRHRPFDDYVGEGLIERIFPPQSFLMPASTPYGHASNQPVGYAKGHSSMNDRGLTGLMNTSMHREDRARMEDLEYRARFHRPRTNNFTCYELHINGEHHEADIARRWSTRGAWPRISTQAMDQNLGAHELQESDWHLLALDNLRASVMRNVTAIPGIPTCKDTIHQPTGMHIRSWSQQGLSVKNVEPLPWSEESDRITLGAGSYLNTIPLIAPRVWFGFTSMGPRPQSDPPGDHAQLTSESASEKWARAYLKHRRTVLTQLFYPERIQLGAIVEDATSARAKRLSRAGRIKKAGEQQSNSAFAQAFNNAIKKDD